MNLLERRKQVKKQLSTLSPSAKVAFAAGCAERVMPNCREFCLEMYEIDVFGELVDKIWLYLSEEKKESLAGLSEHYAELIEYFPEEDSLPDKEQAVIEYSCTAALSTLGQLTGDEIDGASDAASCIWELLEIALNECDFTQEMILELERQYQDLSLLYKSGDLTSIPVESLELLRNRAKRDPYDLIHEVE